MRYISSIRDIEKSESSLLLKSIQKNKQDPKLNISVRLILFLDHLYSLIRLLRKNS